MDGYFCIGSFIKPHGYKGKIIAFIELKQKIKFSEPIFVEIEQILVPFFVEEFFYKSQNQVVFTLEGLNTENDANKLRQHKIYLTRDFYDQIFTEEIDKNIVGYDVIDMTHGYVGQVEEILKYPGHEVLQIKDNNKNEVLIPFNDTYILEINHTHEKVHINTPDGLLELYQTQ